MDDSVPDPQETEPNRSTNHKDNPTTSMRFRVWDWLFKTNSNHVIALATVVAAGAAIFYTHYAAAQLAVIRDQLGAAIEYNRLTKIAADAAKSAADTAAETLRQSTQQFRLDQRPWVEIEIGEPTLKSAADGTFPSQYKYSFGIKNTGKTTAFDISCRVPRQGFSAGQFFGDNPVTMAGEQTMLLRERPFAGASETDKVTLLSKRMPKVLGPGTTSLTTLEVFGQSPKNGMFNYLTGRIDYTDAFSEKHWTSFCFFVDAGGILRYCREGNDKDRNYEPSPNQKR
jgi:hypothetical protein